MSNDAFKNLKAMALILPKIEKSTDSTEKDELLDEFYNLAAPVTQEILGEVNSYQPTGFTAAEQIKKITFEL